MMEHEDKDQIQDLQEEGKSTEEVWYEEDTGHDGTLPELHDGAVRPDPVLTTVIDPEKKAVMRLGVDINEDRRAAEEARKFTEETLKADPVLDTYARVKNTAGRGLPNAFTVRGASRGKWRPFYSEEKYTLPSGKLSALVLVAPRVSSTTNLSHILADKLDVYAKRRQCSRSDILNALLLALFNEDIDYGILECRYHEELGRKVRDVSIRGGEEVPPPEPQD